MPRVLLVLAVMVATVGVAHAGGKRVAWKQLDLGPDGCTTGDGADLEDPIPAAATTSVVVSSADGAAAVQPGCAPTVDWKKYALVYVTVATKTTYTVKKVTRRGKHLTVTIVFEPYCSGIDQPPHQAIAWLRVPAGAKDVTIKDEYKSTPKRCSNVP